MRPDTAVNNETYLGDGLYASFDGFRIVLRAPREQGDHVIVLEPAVYRAIVAFAARECGWMERRQPLLP